jgi:hypothetical protein
MNRDEQRQADIEAARSDDPVALDRLLRLCQPDIRRYAQRSCFEFVSACVMRTPVDKDR